MQRAANEIKEPRSIKIISFYIIRKMLNILCLAYQLSPHRGSEYSVSWNYLKEMSKEHRITVLYGANGKDMGDFDPVEEYQSLLPNVVFIPVKPPFLANAFNALNRKGILIYTFYFAYRLWHKEAFKIASCLLKSGKNFHLIHYLNPIGYREPGFLWKLDLPYMWGPIGGLADPAPILFLGMSWKKRIKMKLKELVNRFQKKHSRRIRRAVLRADALLVATTQNAKEVERLFHRDCNWLPENGIFSKDISSNLKKSFDGNLRLIWVGSIDGRKNLELLLEALSTLDERDRSLRLDVIGDGPLKDAMQARARELALEDLVRWHGQLSRQETLQRFQSAHCHIITSLGEGNPTTLWEAMASGTPTISLDHCGMHDVICENCGIKIPLGAKKAMIGDLANAIRKLDNDRNLLRKLSAGCFKCAERFSWENRHQFFNRCYGNAIDHYNRMHS